MLLFLIAIIILVCGIIMSISCDYSGREVGIGLTVIGSVFMIILLILLPIQQYSTKVDVCRFQETVRTINDARSNPDISEFELAALQQEVIDSNRWLIKHQKWAKTKVCNWFYHSSIFDLERIK